MKAMIDPDTCISCGLCTGICPDVFGSCADGSVHAKSGTIPTESELTAKEAAESCPTDAIIIEE